MIKNLEELKKELSSSERLYYFGVCILKENRILKKILCDLSKLSWKIVNSFVIPEKFNSEKKKVEFFIKNFLINFLTKEEIKSFTECLKFYKLHNESSLEFVRKERVILYYNGKYEIITKEKIIEKLNIIKKIIIKSEE